MASKQHSQTQVPALGMPILPLLWERACFCFSVIGICPGTCSQSRKDWLKHKLLLHNCLGSLGPVLWNLNSSLVPYDSAGITTEIALMAATQNINPFNFLVKTMLLNPTRSVYPEISSLDPLTTLHLLPRACCEMKLLPCAHLILSTGKPFPYRAPFCTDV